MYKRSDMEHTHLNITETRKIIHIYTQDVLCSTIHDKVESEDG